MKKRHSNPNIVKGGKTPLRVSGRGGRTPKSDCATAAPAHKSPAKYCRMK